MRHGNGVGGIHARGKWREHADLEAGMPHARWAPPCGVVSDAHGFLRVHMCTPVDKQEAFQGGVVWYSAGMVEKCIIS
jgi:hypothetical protein